MFLHFGMEINVSRGTIRQGSLGSLKSLCGPRFRPSLKCKHICEEKKISLDSLLQLYHPLTSKGYPLTQLTMFSLFVFVQKTQTMQKPKTVFFPISQLYFLHNQHSLLCNAAQAMALLHIQ